MMSSGQDYRYKRILDCTEEEASALMEDLKQKGSRRRITPISAEYLNAYTASKSRQMAHKEACKAEQAGKPAPLIAEQFNVFAAECERSARALRRGEVFLPMISPSRPPAPESMANSWAKPPGLYPGPRTLPPPSGLQAPPCLQAPPGLEAPAKALASRLPAYFPPPGLPDPPTWRRAPHIPTPDLLLEGRSPAYFPPPGLPDPPTWRQAPHTPTPDLLVAGRSPAYFPPPGLPHPPKWRQQPQIGGPCEAPGLPVRLPREKRRSLPMPPDAVRTDEASPLASYNVNIDLSMYSSMRYLLIDDTNTPQAWKPEISSEVRNVWGFSAPLGPTWACRHADANNYTDAAPTLDHDDMGPLPEWTGTPPLPDCLQWGERWDWSSEGGQHVLSPLATPDRPQEPEIDTASAFVRPGTLQQSIPSQVWLDPFVSATGTNALGLAVVPKLE